MAGQQTRRQPCRIIDFAGKTWTSLLPNIGKADVLIELATLCRQAFAATENPNRKRFLGQIRQRKLCKEFPRAVSGMFVIRFCVVANIPLFAFDKVVDLGQRSPFQDALDVLSQAKWERNRPKAGLENLIKPTGESTPSVIWAKLIAEAQENAREWKRKYSKQGDGPPAPGTLRDLGQAVKDIILGLAIPENTPITFEYFLKLEDSGAQRIVANELAQREFSAILDFVETRYGILERNSKHPEFRVRRFSNEEIDEIVDLRQMLECYLATHAALHDTKDALITRLLDIQSELDGWRERHLRDADDNSVNEFVEWDRKFHLEFTNRPIARNSLKYLLGILQAQRVHFIRVSAERMQCVLNEHEGIIDELKRRPFRVEALRHAVATHIRAAQMRDEVLISEAKQTNNE